MKPENEQLERDVEGHLVKEVAKLGGKAYKFSSPSNRSVPDRLCCFQQGRLVFVECKAPGKKPTPLQWKVIKFLRDLGFNVLVIDTMAKVDIFIQMERRDYAK